MEINEQLLETIQMMGIKASTSNTLEADPLSARIPELWQRYFSENIEEQIPNKLENGGLLGVYTDYDEEHRGHYSLIVGRQVLAVDVVPDGFTAVEIPAGHYLVFSAEGDMPATVYTMWRTIREYFSQSTTQVRAFTTDFERYNNENPNKIDIYIAIRK